eukprot:425700_1
MEQKTEPKPITPFTNEEMNEIKPQTMNTTNNCKQSYEPFVEEQSYKQNINSVADEKNQSMDLMNSLGTVGTINTNYIQDSMLSNNSISQTNNENNI